MMNKKTIFIFLISLSSMGSMSAMAQYSTPASEKKNTTSATMGQAAQPRTTNSDQKDVDNTAINKRDASGETVTPEEQAAESRSDVEVTRRIRQLITRDESLSTAAKNVKIITQNGNVTLRGVVNSVEESDKIQKAAKQVAGTGTVTNALDVKRR